MLGTSLYRDLLAAIPEQPTGQPTDVYRLYDRTGALLYVGISLSVAERMQQHRNGKRWWPQVARIEITHCSSREAALFHEFVTIQQLQPRYNVQGQATERPADWQFIVAVADRLGKLPAELPDPLTEADCEALTWFAEWLPKVEASWERHKRKLATSNHAG